MLAVRRTLLYHFCCLQRPQIGLSPAEFARHLDRTYAVYTAKVGATSEADYLERLYALDWYICCGCIENRPPAWDDLFAARTNRSGGLLIDALRARAARFFPRDEERQASAITDFWSGLLVSTSAEAVPLLERYDGQRPLVPWLIRVFHNAQLSELRRSPGPSVLPDEVALPVPSDDNPWRVPFADAAHAWLATLNDEQCLLLGLLWRYGLSQREVASKFGIHEGNISKRLDKLTDQFHAFVAARLEEAGWVSGDLYELVRTELASVLTDAPQLAGERLAGLLHRKQATRSH
jgi:RNA polymerase sigma factor (sigma-70 family)